MGAGAGSPEYWQRPTNFRLPFESVQNIDYSLPSSSLRTSGVVEAPKLPLTSDWKPQRHRVVLSDEEVEEGKKDDYGPMSVPHAAGQPVASPDLPFQEKRPIDLDICPGDAELAAFVASDRDLAVFRRFDGLSARNLIFLQRKLQLLEDSLYELDDFELAYRRSAGTNLDDKILMRVDGEKETVMEQVSTAIKDYRNPSSSSAHKGTNTEDKLPQTQH